MGKVFYVDENGKSSKINSTKSSTASTSFKMTDSGKNRVTQTTKPLENPTAKTAKPVSTYYLGYSTLDSKLSLDQIVDKMNKSVNIIDDSNTSPITVWNKYTTAYNRFKLPTTNDKLQRGFAHVFFVKPNCNIFQDDGYKLTSSLSNNQVFSYVMKNSSNLVRELSMTGNSKHDFMLSLSNKSTGFSLNDEYIKYDTYGKTYTGYSVAYGKHNIESKAANSFQVTYEDDKYMHIYQLHKLWVEYISGVYRGSIVPRNSTIMNKILDYAGACYYFLTAEDNETILFWSKYYGVFPTEIPSNQFSWTKGNVIQNTDISITYQYSFKEDYNPVAITEFNRNARVYNNKSLKYVPTYDKELGHVGNTWVGKPFIETIEKEVGAPYMYKLRFLED